MIIVSFLYKETRLDMKGLFILCSPFLVETVIVLTYNLIQKKIHEGKIFLIFTVYTYVTMN